MTVVLAMTASIMMAGEIFVSPAGNDGAAGTASAPLKTIQRALRLAREWRRTGNANLYGGIRIVLEGGSEFQLDEPLYIRPEDSGSPECKTVICSGGSSQAIISGGVTLLKNFMGVTTYDAPCIGGRPLLIRSLWAGDKKLRMAASFGDGVMEPMVDFSKDVETITIPAATLAKFGITDIKDAPQLEMLVHQRWAIAILRVRDIRIQGDRAILSFLNPESRWEFSHPWPQPVIDGERGTSAYFLRNAQTMLDENDEWYQDYRTGQIQLGSAANDNLVAPRLNRLVTIEGNSGEQVHDIVFENVAFEYAAWERPGQKGHVTLQGGFPIIDAYKLTENEGLPWAKTLENQAWVERPEAAVSLTFAKRVDFKGCTFKHLAATALDYVDGCSEVSIKDNTFEDIGGTAIMAGSFAEGSTEVHRPYGISTQEVSYQHPETSAFTIEGNSITDATNEDWGAVAIGCGFVRDFTISNNRVSHVNYSGICIGWGWTARDTGMRNNKILNNMVTDYARQLYDAGGIYTMSLQSGSLIKGNTVSTPHQAPYATNYRAFPIYFDACSDGFTVYDNNLETTKTMKEKYGWNTPGPAMHIDEK